MRLLTIERKRLIQKACDKYKALHDHHETTYGMGAMYILPEQKIAFCLQQKARTIRGTIPSQFTWFVTAYKFAMDNLFFTHNMERKVKLIILYVSLFCNKSSFRLE